MKKIRVFLSILLIFLISDVVNADTGTTEMKFLTIVPDARQTALGECGSIFSPTILAAQTNPSQVAFIEGIEFSGSYLQYIGDTSYSCLGLAFPVTNFLSLGLTGTYLDGGKFIERDFEGRDMRTIKPYSGATSSVAVATKLLSNLSLGINTKTVNETINDKSVNYFAVDLGATFNLNNFSVGIGLQNLSQENLPTKAVIGIGYQFINLSQVSIIEQKRRQWKLTVLAEYEYQFKETKSWPNLGLEWNSSPLSLRVGCSRLGSVESRFSAGLGLKIKNFSFDYAYVPYSYLGDTHRLIFSMRLGRVVPDKEPPRILLTQPTEKKFTTSEKELVIEGEIEDNKNLVMITIGGKKILKKLKSYKFSETITISAGTNNILISARDQAGNETNQEIIVEYIAPKPVLGVAMFESRNSGQTDAITVSDYFRNTLIEKNVFNVVDKNNMSKILRDHGFEEGSGCASLECGLEIGKILKVNKVVIGNLTKRKTLFAINAMMINVNTGVVEWSDSKTSLLNTQIETAMKELVDSMLSSIGQ